jgi:ornithine cyclodeaminase
MSHSGDPRLIRAEACERAVDPTALIDEIARGFVAYSNGRARVPPVGHLGFTHPAGDLHIKYGHVEGEDVFVIKMATGFPGNVSQGLPTGDGAILLFARQTGLLRAVLLDQGRLTDIRTAAAGAVAARTLAHREVRRIGILGGGVQARLQLRMLGRVTRCRDVMIWNRTRTRAEMLATHAGSEGYRVTVASSAVEVAEAADLLVTATAAREPLFPASAVRAGTHVTAVGADAPGKQELDPALFARADVVVVDSRAQCADHGELAHALAAGAITMDRVRELGEVLADGSRGRRSDDAITICDLTGVAVQDIVVAQHVLRRAPV